MKNHSTALFVTAAMLSCMALSANADGVSNYQWNLPTPGTSAAPAVETNSATPVSPTVETNTDVPYTTSQPAEVSAANTSLSNEKTNVELAETVNRIGQKILQANNVQEKITFKLVDQNVVNAATDAQDTIYVFTGLLKYCTNEDELAFVLGHEIGHAVKNHVIKSVAIETTAAVGAQVGSKVVANELGKTKLNSKLKQWGFGNVLTNTSTTAINATAAAGVAKLNRGQETDSDILGLTFAVNAGYNPNAAITILEKIGENYVDFFENHPSTDKRVAALQKYISEKYPDYAKK